MTVVTLKVAKEAGLKHYFTGKPCKRGHIDVRFVGTRVCAECNRQSSRSWSRSIEAHETRRATERKRRQIARDAGRLHYFTGRPCKRGHIDKRFLSSYACVTCVREKAGEAFRNLSGKEREDRREYERSRWQNKEFRERQRQYARGADERAKKSIRNREWKKANRASCTDRQNKRNAALYANFIEDVSLEFLFERDEGCCQLCGELLSMNTKWPHPRTPTRDHIVPVTKEGTHECANMQLACAECNIRKGNRCA